MVLFLIFSKRGFISCRWWISYYIIFISFYWSTCTCLISAVVNSPDIRHIRAPLQVFGDGVKIYKEAREQKHRNSGDWTHKRGHLWTEHNNHVKKHKFEFFMGSLSRVCKEGTHTNPKGTHTNPRIQRWLGQAWPQQCV